MLMKLGGGSGDRVWDAMAPGQRPEALFPLCTAH